jgi:hypothetical protein
MASIISATTLIAKIMARGDLRAIRFPPETILEWINDSIAALWDIIISYDDTRILSAASIAVVSGTAAYDLPDDYYLERGVSLADSSSLSGFITLARYQWAERNNYTYATDKQSAMWDIQGGQLWVWPKPRWGGTIRLEYIPVAPVIDPAAEDLNSRVFDSINGWTEWVVNDVLIKCAMVDENNPSPFIMERDRAEARIRRASPQTRSGPRCATSVYSSEAITPRIGRER